MRGAREKGILLALGHSSLRGDALQCHLCLLQSFRTNLHQGRHVPQCGRIHHLRLQLLGAAPLWDDHGQVFLQTRDDDRGKSAGHLDVHLLPDLTDRSVGGSPDFPVSPEYDGERDNSQQLLCRGNASDLPHHQGLWLRDLYSL